MARSHEIEAQMKINYKRRTVNVNGIEVLVFPDSNPVRVLSNYEQAVSLNRKVVS